MTRVRRLVMVLLVAAVPLFAVGAVGAVPGYPVAHAAGCYGASCTGQDPCQTPNRPWPRRPNSRAFLRLRA